MKNQKSKIKNSLKAKSYKLKADDGITLYLAMLVMGGAVAVALSVSTVFIGEFKITSDTVNSLKAVYVADSAMEYALYQARPGGEYTYDSDLNPNGLMTIWGPLSSSDMNTTISHNLCPPGLPADETICMIKIKFIPKDSGDPMTPVTCSESADAQDCTKVFARGSFRGVNRALEIVYPNL